jgi:glycosyltransferase involved in cell wall biosynthesis
MRVLTLIIAFNDATVIQQAIDGLQRQTRPSDAIVIVDNASTKGCWTEQTIAIPYRLSESVTHGYCVFP